MNALKFKLSGRFAFFKEPTVNNVLSFSYGQIHRVALLGILGAIMGYGGYNEQYRKGLNSEVPDFPEFYEKLNGLKIGVVPLSENGVFHMKKQVFTNTVGFASKEQGGILIVPQIWLENPAWEIYIDLETGASETVLEELKNRLLNRRFVYMPYLGCNDHPADLTDIQEVVLERSEDVPETIGALVQKDDVSFFTRAGFNFMYSEILPVALEQQMNQYVSKEFVFTDATVQDVGKEVYVDDESGRTIVFY